MVTTTQDLTAVTVANETRIAKALDSLPTLPVVAIQIGEVVHGKNVSVQQVAALLRSDPATSAKLLRLVNSPYFGIPGGVADVERAIPFVGFNTLYQLVLSIGVLEALGSKSKLFDARALWVHSLTVATAARELAGELKFSDPGACFTAGLLHDMGKIALAKVEPKKLADAFELMKTEGLTIAEAERRQGLPAHDKIGSRLAKAWKFPATLTTPIEHHHSINRPEVRGALGPNLRTICEIVASADYLSRRCAEPFTADQIAEDGETEQELFQRNGFSEAQQTSLCDRTKAQLEKSKVFLSLFDG